MSVTENLDDLVSLLKKRPRGVTRRDLEARWNCSSETARRMLARARDERGVAYVPADVRRGIYRLDPAANIEAPAMFFRPDQLAALLGLAHWLESLGSGVLTGQLAPVKSSLHERLRAHDIDPALWEGRVRLLPMQSRQVDPEVLLEAARAVLLRKRIGFRYKGSGEASFRDRTASPQRLVRYRDNWSLDAWCHQRRAFRQFALSRMKNLVVTDTAAKTFSDPELDAHFAEAYGLFAGPARRRAQLVFEGDAARIMSEERWHPQQSVSHLKNGRIRLEFPCGDVRELARDVMRFADEVTVEGPPILRKAVAGMVRHAGERLKP